MASKKSTIFLGYDFPHGLEVQKIILISKSLITTRNPVKEICRNGTNIAEDHGMKVRGKTGLNY